MCEHHNFNATVRVARIEDKGRYMAEVQIKCLDCGVPMQFMGLQPDTSIQDMENYCRIKYLENGEILYHDSRSSFDAVTTAIICATSKTRT